MFISNEDKPRLLEEIKRNCQNRTIICALISDESNHMLKMAMVEELIKPSMNQDDLEFGSIFRRVASRFGCATTSGLIPLDDQYRSLLENGCYEEIEV